MARKLISSEKIDVHGMWTRYERGLVHLENDSSVCDVNKRYICEFLKDCSLGKTILKRSKKKIDAKRLIKYLYTLRRISFWLGNKDFKSINQGDMDLFILKVEGNRLPCLKNPGTTLNYSVSTQHDIKVCLRKFYKWLLGGNRRHPDLVEWIDTSYEEGPPPFRSIDEIRKAAEFATTVRGKAIVWTMFQSSARAEEFLNIRISHAVDKQSHFQIGIEFPKKGSFKRKNPVYEGADYLREWIQQHPDNHNPDAQLFPLSYEGLVAFLRRLGIRALGKPLFPQLLRDSLATWLAGKKVGRYQMCKIMGWAMSSKMPDRYINRTGVVEEEAIKAIRGDKLSEVERENSELRAILARIQVQLCEMQDDAAKRKQKEAKRKEIDSFLNDLLIDDEIGKRLVKIIEEKGLGKKVASL